MRGHPRAHPGRRTDPAGAARQLQRLRRADASQLLPAPPSGDRAVTRLRHRPNGYAVPRRGRVADELAERANDAGMELRSGLLATTSDPERPRGRLPDGQAASRAQLSERRVAQRPLSRRWRRCAATIEKPAPVSYTHLRAHETVLDLVC